MFVFTQQICRAWILSMWEKKKDKKSEQEKRETGSSKKRELKYPGRRKEAEKIGKDQESKDFLFQFLAI